MSVAITYFVTYFTEAMTACLFFEGMFSKKRNGAVKYFCFAVVYAAQYFLSLYHIVNLNAITFILGNLFLMLFLYETGFGTALFYSVLLIVFMGLPELIAGSVLGSVYRDYDAANMTQPIFIIYFLISKGLYFLLCLLIVKLNRKRSGRIKWNMADYILFAIPVITVICTLILIYISADEDISHTNEFLIAGICCAMLVMNVFVYVLHDYNQAQQEKLLHLQFESQLEADSKRFYEMMRQNDTDQRILVHDMKHHLQTIAALASDGEDVSDYVKNIIELPALNETVRVSRSGIVNLVMSRYIHICRKSGIRMDTDMQSGDLDFMREEAAAALISNLLDNAVEAVGSDEPFIHVKLVSKSGNNMTIFTVVNSCEKAPVFSENGLPVTHKEDKNLHGFGLRSIDKLVEDYGGIISRNYDEDKKTFTTIIIFKGINL